MCPLQTFGSTYFNVVYILGERREGEGGGGHICFWCDTHNSLSLEDNNWIPDTALIAL